MIYLDHNATSPLLPEILEVMRPWLGAPANPASAHSAGQRAAAAVERAREEVAALVHGNVSGVVFTSGATEANHLFLRGAIRINPARRRLAVSAIEHPCVLGAARLAAEEGFAVDLLAVGADGVVPVADVRPDTAVVSLMAANHETGVVQDIRRARHVSASVGALLHVDATQAAGRIPLVLGDVDGVVFSSHKLGGPSGVGCLVLRNGGPFPALLTGGAQERGRRAGTVNVPGVVGFGEACRLARVWLAGRSACMNALSADVRTGLVALGSRLVGAPERLLPNTTCAVFPGVAGEAVVQALDLRGICVSSGAACASGSLEPSPVLRAMGDPEPRGGVRVSLGPTSRATDVHALLEALAQVLPALREEGGSF